MPRSRLNFAALGAAFLAATLVVLSLSPLAALAQGAVAGAALPSTGTGVATTPTQATTVIVPYGDWAIGILNLAAQVLYPALLALATTLLAKFAPFLKLFISTQLVERTVQNALNYALNEVSGAVKGRTLEVNVGAAVLARAVARAVEQAPGWLLEAAGGQKGIAEKVFRLMNLEDKASAANVLEPVLKGKVPIPATHRAADASARG